MVNRRAVHLRAVVIVLAGAGVSEGVVSGVDRARGGANGVAAASSIRILPAATLLPGELAVVNGCAALVSAEAIIDMFAALTELIVSRVVGTNRTGASATRDLDITDSLNGITIAGASALVLSEPRIIALPVGDNEDHTILQVVGHLAEIATIIGSHLLAVSVLRKGGREAVEIAAVVLEELNPDLEGLFSVDGILAARTEVIPSKLLSGVVSANTVAIAGVVVTLVAGRVALVRSSGKGPLATFLEVELRAEVTAPLSNVSVTVEVAVSVPELATLVFGGHGHGVESVEAAALVPAHIGGPLNRGTKEVRGPEVRVGLIEEGSIEDEAAVIHLTSVRAARGGAAVGGDVLGLDLAVNSDSDGSEVAVLLVRDLGREPFVLGIRAGLDGGGDDSSNESAHL